MPDNPLYGKAGNLTRCHQMLRYFQDHQDIFEVHFLSSLYWKEEDIKQFDIHYPSIRLIVEPVKSSKKNRIKYFFVDKMPNLLYRFFNGIVVSMVSPHFKKRIDKLYQANQYDIVIISYVGYGELVDHAGAAYKIVDTHDFYTLQHLQKQGAEAGIGRMFQQEMDILKKFDEIWTYSIEEEYVFGQFTNKEVRLIPISFKQTILPEERLFSYDVVYVASNNPHNIKSINWFVKEVLPLLPDLKVHVIGRICEHIADHPQLQKLGLVEDIHAIYSKSKLTICPMLSGTGIKIKVLESLSYGIPVVTSRRGVDGLINKIDNGCLVANDAKAFADYIKRLLEDDRFYKDISQQAVRYFSLYHKPEMERSVLDRALLTKESTL